MPRLLGGVVCPLIAITLCAGCGSQNTSGSSKAATAQCEAAPIPTAVSDASDVELIIAAGSSIPRGSWVAYKRMATQVASCLRPGARLDIHAITASSFSTPPLFSSSMPQSDGSNANPLLLRERRRAFADAVSMAIDSLPKENVGGKADPIGALKVAADELSDRPRAGNRIIVAIFSGWQQAPPINMYAYHIDPRNLIRLSVYRLTAAGEMPRLSGTVVDIYGISAGAMGLGDMYLQEMCGYWMAIIRAGGGTLRHCSASAAPS